MQQSVYVNIRNKYKQHQQWQLLLISSPPPQQLDHLDSLRKRHAYRLNSWVGYKMCGANMTCVCDTKCVAQIWLVSVTPVGWRKYGLCLWHQLDGANMAYVCDTRCVAQIWPVSLTPVGWRKYGPCLWNQLGSANTAYVCETRYVAQIWPVSVTPKVWRRYDLCLRHQLGGANVTVISDTNSLNRPICRSKSGQYNYVNCWLSASGDWVLAKTLPI